MSDDGYRLFEVFTPTRPARTNFVARTRLEDRLTECLLTPGKQVIVYGESGSGKSSLVNKKLRECYEWHITTRCTKATRFEAIVLDAFDKLDYWYSETRSTDLGSAKKGKLEASLGVLKASLESANSITRSSSKRALTPQLTAQRLGEVMGEAGCCWLIEDFHKVPADEKVFLSQTLKVFSDLSFEYDSLRVVALGATDTAREVVEYDAEMKNRIAEIHVPLMNDGEIGAIVDHGGRYLNVDFKNISSDIVKFSAGLPSVCHGIALNACLERKFLYTLTDLQVLSRTDCDSALKRYVEESSDSLKAAFERALMRRSTRKFDNPRLILTALVELGPDGGSHSEILKRIRESKSDYPASNLTSYLKALCLDARGAVLRRLGDGRYRFSEQLYFSYAQAMLTPESTVPEWPGIVFDSYAEYRKHHEMFVRFDVLKRVSYWVTTSVINAQEDDIIRQMLSGDQVDP